MDYRTVLPQRLLDILICPACSQPLAYRTDRNDFRCAACRRVYPVRDEIPILLVDQARIDD